MGRSGSPVERLHRLDPKHVEDLADVLVDCVQGLASIGFMLPFSRERAVEFWRGVGAEVEAGRRALLIASDDTGVCGTVQVVLAQPDNQPHRGDVTKMLVHRRARRRGIGAALMKAAEEAAIECGKTLLVLDTASDDAERLYERSGWTRVGTIPGYALLPQGGLCDTVVFYRNLETNRG
jgi:ribosomal protein S18 acetylase RimI-like enzyme